MVVITNTENELTFDLKLQGASLKEVEAFLTLQTENKRVQIPVKVSEQGFCEATVEPGTLKYGTTGTLMIEVFAKDLKFVPWQDEFLIEQKSTVTFKQSEILEEVKKEVKKQEKIKQADLSTVEKAKTLLMERLTKQPNPTVERRLVALEESVSQKVEKLMQQKRAASQIENLVNEVEQKLNLE